jgi:hypothetical protein
VQNELHLRYIHIVQTEQHSDNIVQTELHLRYIHNCKLGYILDTYTYRKPSYILKTWCKC